MSSKSTTSRESKTPLNHLKHKKWCFPPSPLRQSSGGSGSSPQPAMSASLSPEPNCAICLGKIEDKAFTDRCFHCFCRLCLFEWAKVKAECPVCRQAFEKIIYNIRSMDDYDEQAIQTAQHRHRFGGHFHSPFAYHPFVSLDGNQRFRYPTTLTPLRRRMMDFERRLQLQLHMSEFPAGYQTFPHFLHMIDNRRVRDQRLRSSAVSNAINNNNTALRNSTARPFSPSSSRTSGAPLGLNERHRFRGEDPMISGQSSQTWNPVIPNYYANPFEMDIFPPPAGTSAHRRYVYDSDLWVLTNGDGNTSRTREVSARFFSSNPACTHRLIPWLNRELNSILQNPNETETLIPRIMNALLMYDITSVGFKKIIAPFTHNRTNHFIHEFYNFARSPYDMEQYTRNATYVPRHRADIVESEPLPGPIGYQMETDSPQRLSPPYGLSPESISSSGSSIEILDDPFIGMAPTPNPHRRGMPTISSPQSPDIFSIDGSDSGESSTEIRQLITPSPVNTPSLHETRAESEVSSNKDISVDVSNPTPLPRGDLPDVNFRNINIIDDFDNPKPGTSGLSRSMRSTAQTKWSDSDTDVDVGDELEAAIARFEKNYKPEVKTEANIENKTTDGNSNERNGNDSDTSCSSVLIVGYVKPLHERTPEFVNLISSDEQKDDENNTKESHKVKKSKKSKKVKHRKRSSVRSRSKSRSRSPSDKRKGKHKSRNKEREKDKERHKQKWRRMSRHYRSSSTSSSSSSSSSDELKQLTKSLNKRQHKHRSHRKHSSDSKRVRYSPNGDKRYLDFDRKPVSTTTSTTTSTNSSSRPPSLGSVVIVKQPIESQRFNHYSVYSDSD